MKLIEAKTAKEFAGTFFNDPILKMAINAAIDNAPGFDLVQCKDCKHWAQSGQGCGYCKAWEQGRVQDHYCSCGEKRSS